MSTQTLSYSELIERAPDVARGFIQTHVMRVQGLSVEWSFQEPIQSQATSGETANAHVSAQGLASLLGKYDNDPSWDEFPAFLEQYRREIDEMNRD